MVRRLLALAKQFLLFVETAEMNKEEIRDLRREFAEMILEMERLNMSSGDPKNESGMIAKSFAWNWKTRC